MLARSFLLPLALEPAALSFFQDPFTLKAKRRDIVLRESRTRRASDCELAPDRPTCGRRDRDGASVIRSTGQRQFHPEQVWTTRAGDRSGGFPWLWRQRVKLDDALERVKVRIFVDERSVEALRGGCHESIRE